MIVESLDECRIGQVVEVCETDKGGPTARAMILRPATFEEFLAEVRLRDPEFDKYAHCYFKGPGFSYYEVSVD